MKVSTDRNILPDEMGYAYPRHAHVLTLKHTFEENTLYLLLIDLIYRHMPLFSCLKFNLFLPASSFQCASGSDSELLGVFNGQCYAKSAPGRHLSWLDAQNQCLQV